LALRWKTSPEREGFGFLKKGLAELIARRRKTPPPAQPNRELPIGQASHNTHRHIETGGANRNTTHRERKGTAKHSHTHQTDRRLHSPREIPVVAQSESAPTSRQYNNGWLLAKGRKSRRCVWPLAPRVTTCAAFLFARARSSLGTCAVLRLFGDRLRGAKRREYQHSSTRLPPGEGAFVARAPGMREVKGERRAPKKKPTHVCCSLSCRLHRCAKRLHSDPTPILSAHVAPRTASEERGQPRLQSCRWRITPLRWWGATRRSSAPSRRPPR
jgi:hypothetical protein